MATAGNLIVNLRARTASFDAAMGRSGRRLSAFGAQARMAQGAMNLLRGALVGISAGGALAFLKGTITAFAEEEQIVRGLADTLEGVQKGASAAMPAMQAFAAQVQRQTVIGDEAVLGLMKLGAGLGRLTGEGLQQATIAAIGLSRRLGIDAESAMTLLAKAAQGNTASLSRYGLVLSETLTPQQKFNELLRMGAESFAIARGEAETTTGKIKQLANAWGDLKEKIGEKVAPSATYLAQNMTAALQVPEQFIMKVGEDLTRGLRGAIGPGGNLIFGGLLGDVEKRIHKGRLAATYTPALPIGKPLPDKVAKAAPDFGQGLLSVGLAAAARAQLPGLLRGEPTVRDLWRALGEGPAQDLWAGANAQAAALAAVGAQGGADWISTFAATGARAPQFANVGSAALATDRLTHQALPGDEALRSVPNLLDRQITIQERMDDHLRDLVGAGGLE